MNDSVAAVPRPAPKHLDRLFGGIAGSFLLRPWFDAIALPGILRWYFPLSRAWAAAEVAGHDPEIFRREVPTTLRLRRMLGPALAVAARDRALYREADAAWRAAYFEDGTVAADRLLLAEERRVEAAHRWMATRQAFLPMHVLRPFPAVKWQLPPSETVALRHSARLGRPEAAFPAPEAPPIGVSQAMPVHSGSVRWLRFPSRRAGVPDVAWARVYEPQGVRDPATLIFLHGIGVESEFWRGEIGRAAKLRDAGIRIVRPEAPWHGRRRETGWFGGEPIMAQGPLGMIELFAAWVAELAVLTAWARGTSRGPVAVGGISLGALTAQRAAAAAAFWPEMMRPDALLLVGTTADVVAAATVGAIGRGLRVTRRLAEEAWPEDAVERWRPLLEPQNPPALPPEHIIMAIGSSDEVTPAAGALTLAERWKVPADNIFRRPQGHFSLALGLEHDGAPFERLASLLHRLRGAV
jgi:pimeloyl-ACP methyl ester carboxylesterase